SCLWELDILRHLIRKLRTYEEVHTVFTRHLRCDGIYRFLSAGGNDSYRRTRQRVTRVYESSCAVPNALAQEARLDFGLRKAHACLRFFEIALVLVRLDHVASIIIDLNHGIM